MNETLPIQYLVLKYILIIFYWLTCLSTIFWYYKRKDLSLGTIVLSFLLGPLFFVFFLDSLISKLNGKNRTNVRVIDEDEIDVEPPRRNKIKNFKFFRG